MAGGLPREDTTPKVMEAVRALNAQKDANGCMHDESTGRFTSECQDVLIKPLLVRQISESSPTTVLI